MNIFKIIKDYLIKLLLGKNVIPEGLLELNRYFRRYNGITFEIKKERDRYIAISKDYRYGSIITSGRNKQELDKNIKDAILTSFEVPSSYSKEANIKKVGENSYALA